MESQHGFTGTTSEMQTDTRGVPGGVPVGVHSSSQGRGGLFAVLPGLVDHPRHAGRPVVSLSSGTPITTAPHVTSELDKAHRVDHRPHLAPTPNDRATTRRSPPPQRQHPPPVTRRPLARPLPGLQACRSTPRPRHAPVRTRPTISGPPYAEACCPAPRGSTVNTRWMCSRNSVMKFWRNVVVSASEISPDSANTSGRKWMYASGAVIWRALQKLSTPRRLCCATAVPICPIDAPITAAGMWSNEFCPHGREAQSIAFFNAPGMDRLYSGVTNRTASDAARASLSARASGG